MYKVTQSFYCLVEEKQYSKGEDYNGKRSDKLVALGYIKEEVKEIEEEVIEEAEEDKPNKKGKKADEVIK